jgi:integrase
LIISTVLFYTEAMKKRATEGKSVWERTSVQCLLRNRDSGIYYGRFTVHGKQKWFALETDVFSVAKLRVADKAALVEKTRGAVAHVAAGKATMGELMDVYLARTESNPDFKPATVAARIVALKKLEKTWPELRFLEPKQITPTLIFDWATKFKINGTNYVPPGATKAIKGNSATSVNRAIDTLRRLMDIAIERGQIHSNPVLVRPSVGRLKKKIVSQPLVLPSMREVERLFIAIENNGARGGWGIEAADLCRFLTYSGERISEVPVTTWRCVDWDRKQMRIPGTKSETSDRFIPLFPALARLLKKIQKRRQAAARFTENNEAFLKPSDPIFRLSECQKSIDTACSKIGIQRMTHHDFRHLFATICIESGVDIPTVSVWLGHNDGGVLAMKTYGHLRRDHSQLVAAKVKFGQT